MWMDFFIILGKFMGSMIRLGVTVGIVLFVLYTVYKAIFQEEYE